MYSVIYVTAITMVLMYIQRSFPQDLASSEDDRGRWSLCSASCGLGVQIRRRACVSVSEETCSAGLEERRCYLEPCSSDGQGLQREKRYQQSFDMEAWTPWRCDCETHQMWRIKRCLGLLIECHQEPSAQAKLCTESQCTAIYDRKELKVDQKEEGIYTMWSRWGRCSCVRTGEATGYTSRTRICVDDDCKQYPAFAGAAECACVDGQTQYLDQGPPLPQAAGWMLNPGSINITLFLSAGLYLARRLDMYDEWSRWDRCDCNSGTRQMMRRCRGNSGLGEMCIRHNLMTISYVAPCKCVSRSRVINWHMWTEWNPCDCSTSYHLTFRIARCVTSSGCVDMVEQAPCVTYLQDRSCSDLDQSDLIQKRRRYLQSNPPGDTGVIMPAPIPARPPARQPAQQPAAPPARPPARQPAPPPARPPASQSARQPAPQPPRQNAPAPMSAVVAPPTDLDHGPEGVQGPNLDDHAWPAVDDQWPPDENSIMVPGPALGPTPGPQMGGQPNGRPPAQTPVLTEVTAYPLTKFSMSCDVANYAFGEVVWYKDGVLFTPKIPSEPATMLKFGGVKPDDEAIYTCVMQTHSFEQELQCVIILHVEYTVEFDEGKFPLILPVMIIILFTWIIIAQARKFKRKIAKKSG